MFNLAHLRSFVVLAEELHFGRAAVRLNLTQPPLTRQIQVLERVLGVALLERSSRSVRLTSTGRHFLPEARRLVRAAETAAALAQRLESGKAGSLRLTFTAASACRYLPGLLTAAAPLLASLELSLREMNSRDQLEGILAGEADVGLLRPPVSRSELEFIRVLTEQLVVALPEHHPLAGAPHVALSALDGEPFIMYASGEARYFHNLLTGLFAAANVAPHYVQHLSHDHSILALVKAGLGCALVPESAASLRYEGVVFRPLDRATAVPVELFMVWRRDNDNPTVALLVDLVRAMLAAG